MIKKSNHFFCCFHNSLEYLSTLGRQHANGETKRRNFKAKIEKVLKEKAIKKKCFYNGQQRKARKTQERHQQLSVPVPSSERNEAIEKAIENEAIEKAQLSRT